MDGRDSPDQIVPHKAFLRQHPSLRGSNQTNSKSGIATNSSLIDTPMPSPILGYKDTEPSQKFTEVAEVRLH